MAARAQVGKGWVVVGLGCIAALYYRLSTSYQIH
jgi:hypothetical protein